MGRPFSPVEVLLMWLLQSVFLSDSTQLHGGPVGPSDINSMSPQGHYYNRRSKWTVDTIIQACDHRTQDQQFVCNPEGILSEKQEKKLNDHLKATIVSDSRFDMCPIELRVILIRDLDEKVVFYGGPFFTSRNYNKALSDIAENVADDVMSDRWETHAACCHKVILIMSYTGGQVRYGLAACKMLEEEDEPLWCTLAETEQFYEMYRRVHDTYCDEINFPVTPEPKQRYGSLTRGASSTLMRTSVTIVIQMG